jgi:energy-coupling factor transport system permease protein
MQDPRIRIGASALLSFSAFASVHGAIAVFLWWLVFTQRLRTLRRIGPAAGLLALVFALAFLLQILYGTGISYGIRMGVILLVGMWLYSEQEPGEFLNAGVWFLGKRAGFELGMIAELALQAMDTLLSDLERIRMAWNIKGIRFGVRNMVPAGSVLVHGALLRAEDMTELLAVRGYRNGGSLCPAFTATRTDIIAGALAAGIGLFGFFNVSDFFILSH